MQLHRRDWHQGDPAQNTNTTQKNATQVEQKKETDPLAVESYFYLLKSCTNAHPPVRD
jgi:hypothetical protein